MISAEMMRKIRHIQIRTKRIVNDALAGEYLSVFKGHGIEFEEVREYAPGDDIRSIDWNVTARSGAPFVKRYREERQLTVVFLVDLSASGNFGSSFKSKAEVEAEICALIAFSAIRNNDRVGLILFTDRVERYVPPLKGQTHVLRIVRELLTAEPVGTGTDLSGALGYLLRVVRRRAVVFLISDFLDRGYSKPFAVAASKHDLNVVRVTDPRERVLPKLGLIAVRDAETGETALMDSSSSAVRAEWTKQWTRRRAELDELCRRGGVGQVDVDTAEDYLDSIVRFFARRRHELGIGA